MCRSKHSRREFFRRSALGLGSAAVPYWWTRSAAAQSVAKNDRPLFGAIGVGGQGTSIAERATQFGDIVAICDVDRKHADAANAKIAGGKAKQFGDYRKLLDRNDIEAVTIGTPDHSLFIKVTNAVNRGPARRLQFGHSCVCRSFIVRKHTHSRPMDQYQLTRVIR